MNSMDVAIWPKCDRSVMFATIYDTAIGIWLMVGHHEIGLTRGRAITNDWRK